jgi:hypothetical protein
MPCEDTGLTLSLKPGVTTEFQIRNRGNGFSEIEGKAARVAATELGQRRSFNAGTLFIFLSNPFSSGRRMQPVRYFLDEQSVIKSKK